MGNTGRYGAINKSTNPEREPGYKKAWISLLSDFTTLQQPTLSSPPVLGEATTIGSDHVFVSGKNPIPVYVKQDTIEATSETVGEIGSLRDMWKPKFFIKGDGPKVQEIVNNLLNEELIVFVQEGCGTDEHYLQFGCKCSPCEITKKTGSSGTLISGQKGTELEFRAFERFTYTGTLPERS